MAPEQAAAQGAAVGPLSDVYSLGAILYETLTGRPPFREATPLDTLVQVLEGEPPPPRQLNPAIPADLELICLRCLEKEPQHRYPSAAALAARPGAFLAGRGDRGPARGLGQRLLRWARREPALVAHLVTLGGCTCIAQVAYQSSPRSVTVVVSRHDHRHPDSLWRLALLCQVLLTAERWAEAMRYVWAALDVAFFTLVLYVDEPWSARWSSAIRS